MQQAQIQNSTAAPVALPPAGACDTVAMVVAAAPTVMKPWLPSTLESTAVQVLADALNQRRPNTLRLYVIPDKSCEYSTKGTTVHAMQAISGRVIRMHEEGMADAFASSSSTADLADVGPLTCMVPRVQKTAAGKIAVVPSSTFHAFGPPLEVKLYQGKTFYIFQKGSAKFKIGYDILVLDIHQMVIPGSGDLPTRLQERVQTMTVLTGRHGGLWHQRYANAMLAARFSEVPCFMGFFHDLENARQTSEGGKTFFETKSPVLVVFGGTTNGMRFQYHTPRSKTLCSMGGQTPGMLSTGIATTRYEPRIVENSKCPISATFIYNEYTRTGTGAERVLQATMCVRIFNPTEGTEPALFTGVPFPVIARILETLNGSFVVGLIPLRGSWESSGVGGGGGGVGEASDAAYPGSSLALALRPSSAYGSGSGSSMLHTLTGINEVGGIPLATASAGMVLDFGDLVLSPCAVLLDFASSVVQNALLGKDTINATAKVNPADLQELTLGIPGTTMGVCPGVAMYLSSEKNRAGLIFYALDTSGKPLTADALKLIAKDAPESDARAGWVSTFMGATLLVLVTRPRGIVREFLATPGREGMLPTASDIPSAMSLEVAAPEDAGHLTLEAAPEVSRKRSRSQSASAEPASKRSRSRSVSRPVSETGDDLE